MDGTFIQKIAQRAAAHAADVQRELQEQEGRAFKPQKHFALSRAEFELLHSQGLLDRLPSAGWYLYREMPVWINNQAG